jgi:hypothetical protein
MNFNRHLNVLDVYLGWYILYTGYYFILMIICDVCEYVKEETAVLLSVIIIISCKRIKNVNSFFF